MLTPKDNMQHFTRINITITLRMFLCCHRCCQFALRRPYFDLEVLWQFPFNGSVLSPIFKRSARCRCCHQSSVSEEDTSASGESDEVSICFTAKHDTLVPHVILFFSLPGLLRSSTQRRRRNFSWNVWKAILKLWQIVPQSHTWSHSELHSVFILVQVEQFGTRCPVRICDCNAPAGPTW